MTMPLADQMAIEQLVSSGQFTGPELQKMLADMIAEYQRQQQSQAYVQRQKAAGNDQGMNPMDAYNQYETYADMFGGGSSVPAGTTGGEGMAGMGSGGVGSGSVGSLTGGEGMGGIFGSGGGETATSAGYGTLGYIAAAILGQHLMSGATDRRTQLPGVESAGHRTGDVFSLDFFTEPWQGFAYDKLGIDVPTPGEKTDASINALRDGENTWDNLLRSAPATGAQWFDPVGSFGYDWLNEKGGMPGKIASKALMPVQWLARLFD